MFIEEKANWENLKEAKMKMILTKSDNIEYLTKLFLNTVYFIHFNEYMITM